MVLIASCHRLALASWMPDKGLIFNALEEEKANRKEINILSAVPISDGVSVFFFPPSTGHVVIGVLQGNRRNHILQSRDASDRLFGSTE